jgi:hypothetical protein
VFFHSSDDLLIDWLDSFLGPICEIFIFAGNDTVGSDSVDPEVELNVALIHAFEDAPAEISCDVEDENSTVEWIKIDGDLPTGSTITGGVLRIPALTFADSGFYECHPAGAESGGAQSLAQIIVLPGTSHLALAARKVFHFSSLRRSKGQCVLARKVKEVSENHPEQHNGHGRRAHCLPVRLHQRRRPSRMDSKRPSHAGHNQHGRGKLDQ